jgi:hypothetical protein
MPNLSLFFHLKGARELQLGGYTTLSGGSHTIDGPHFPPLYKKYTSFDIRQDR